ncbi:hypothetical protein GCM10027051_01410 [Niabella terrae]
MAQQALALSQSKRLPKLTARAALYMADLLLDEKEGAVVMTHNNEALKIALMQKDRFLTALAYLQSGQYYRTNLQYEEAESNFAKALKIGFPSDQPAYQGTLYVETGFVYSKLHRMEMAADYYMRAISLYDKVGNLLPKKAQALSNLSAVYWETRAPEKALTYIKEAVAIRETLNDRKGLIYTYMNISVMYRPISLDSAARYAKLSVDYARQEGEQMSQAKGLANLSMLYRQKNELDAALESILEAVHLTDTLHNRAEWARYMFTAAGVYGALQDNLKAESWYNHAEQVLLELNDKSGLEIFYRSRYRYYQDQADYKNAFRDVQKSQAYRDSLNLERTKLSIAELEKKYETQKKDNEIFQLQTSQKISRLQIEKQQALISGKIAEAGRKQDQINMLAKEQALRKLELKTQQEALEKQRLLTRNERQQVQLITQQKQFADQQIATQKQLLATQRQLRNFIIAAVLLLLLTGFVLFNRYQLKKKVEQQQALLSVRNNIARNLHDEIGSTLTSIKILSELSHRNLQQDHAKAGLFMEKITEQSAAMQQGMSDIVWAISPDNDRIDDLLVRMREFTSHTLEPKEIETLFFVEDDMVQERIGMHQRKDIFMIFKEAVNNAAKYAAASRVEIILTFRDGRFCMQIRDNGKGFEPERTGSSSGLKNMQARAQNLGGHCVIQSAPGQGTSVSVNLPATS